jgi:FkbM family methyltransferase
MLARKIASRLLWRTNLSSLFTFGTPYGYRMRFHPSAISCAMWEDRNFRREEVELLLQFLRPRDTYVDIGANVGTLALAASIKVGSKGRVYAVEASPRTYGFLLHNIQLNGATNITAIHAAMSEEPGTVKFTDSFNDDMNHVGEGQVEVPAITLDSLNIPGEIAFLKSDTEGFELSVIAGGRETLSRCRTVMFECSEHNLRRYGKSCNDLRSTLRSIGFRLEDLRENIVGRRQ